MLLYFKAQIPMWLEFQEWNLLQWFFVKPDQISDNDSFRTFDVLYEGTTNQSVWQQKGVWKIFVFIKIYYRSYITICSLSCFLQSNSMKHLITCRWSLEWVEREQKVRFSSINRFRWSRGSRRCCCFTNLFVDLVTSLSWQVTYLLWLDLEQINSILLNTGAYLFTYFLHDIALMLNVASNKKSHRTFQNTVSNPQRASFFSSVFSFFDRWKVRNFRTLSFPSNSLSCQSSLYMFYANVQK